MIVSESPTKRKNQNTALIENYSLGGGCMIEGKRSAQSVEKSMPLLKIVASRRLEF